MKIGKIISVEFDRFKVRLFSDTKTSAVTIKGRIYYYGNIGSYLKTSNSIGDTILCEVTAVVDYPNNEQKSSAFNLDTSRELVLRPIGVINRKKNFSLGIGIFPMIYNDVEIVT